MSSIRACSFHGVAIIYWKLWFGLHEHSMKGYQNKSRNFLFLLWVDDVTMICKYCSKLRRFLSFTFLTLSRIFHRRWMKNQRKNVTCLIQVFTLLPLSIYQFTRIYFNRCWVQEKSFQAFFSYVLIGQFLFWKFLINK